MKKYPTTQMNKGIMGRKFFNGTMLYRLVLALLFLSASLVSYAGHEVFQNKKDGSTTINGSSILVMDDKYSTMQTSSWGTDFVNAEGQARVIFSVDRLQPYTAGDYQATVTYNLTTYTWNGTSFTANTQNGLTLTVNYTAPGSTSGISYQDKDVYEIKGTHAAGYSSSAASSIVHRMLVTVTSVVVKANQDGSGAVISTNVPVILETQIGIERYYYLDPTAATLSGLHLDHVDLNAVSGELQVSWNVIPGAETYHLEWAWVGDFTATGAQHSSATDVKFDADLFRLNSSRVELTTTSYKIPLMYEQGYIIYRIRPVGRILSNPTVETYGDWSFTPGTCLDAGCAPQKFQFDGHRSNLNWQYSNTFADDGRNQPVISYFDGTLRDRQSVTKSNADNNIIVGEKIYDYAGRPVISVLPVPVNEDKVDYVSNFNVYGTATQPYDKSIFDLNTTGSCTMANTPAMLSSSGAADYYSSGNDFGISGQNAYIPDAQGYPFAQTEFTPDNTGRVRRQGGVGPDHQLGTGHETQNFYGVPFQYELDRLFGNEAGYASHYQKIATVDPNGVVTVAYKDVFGRVVATAIDGQPLSNTVIPLSTDTDPVTIDLLGKVDPADNLEIESNQQQVSQDGMSLTLEQNLVVLTPGDREFYYEVDANKYQESCEEDLVCYDCVLDVEISLRDQCGNELLPSYIEEDEPFTTTVGATNLTCSEEQVTFSKGNLGGEGPVWSADDLAMGEYHLVKKLTINEEALEAYTNDYIAHNTCLKTIQDFIGEMGPVDLSGCNITCVECRASLEADKSWALNKYNEEYNPTCDPCLTLTEYQNLLSQCDELCDNTSSRCEAPYMAMLGDVSPGGQYALYFDKENNVANVSLYNLSVLNSNNSLPRQTTDGGRSSDLWPSVSGLDNKPNWQYPYNPAETDPERRDNYLDENNAVAYVQIIKQADGTYLPHVASANYSQVITVDATNNLYKIKPRYLENVYEFIDAWEESWAKSLVAYHPEYFLYEECIKDISSHNFDDHIRELSLEDAQVEYGANYYLLLTQDPYFTASADPVKIKERKSMLYALNSYSTVSGNHYNMLEMAHSAVTCGDDYRINGGCGVTGCFLANPSGLNYNAMSSQYVRSGFSGFATEEEWRMYVNLYLGAKGDIQEVTTVNKTIDQYGYNACIGNEQYAPYIGNRNFWRGTSGTFANAPARKRYQVCGVYSYFNFRNKTSRWSMGNELSSITGGQDLGVTYNEDLEDYQLMSGGAQQIVNQTQQYGAVAVYQECGLCPNMFYLQELLKAITTNGHLVSSSSYNLTCNSSYHYPELNSSLRTALGVPTGTYPAITWLTTESVESSRKKLEAQISYGSTTVIINFLMPIDADSEWDYTDITQVCCMTPSASSSNLFKLTATDINGKQIILDGEIESLYLNSCTPPQVCSLADITNGLVGLVNALLFNGALENTVDYPLETPASDYAGLITPAMKEEGPAGEWYWATLSTSTPGHIKGKITTTPDNIEGQTANCDIELVISGSVIPATMDDILQFYQPYLTSSNVVKVSALINSGGTTKVVTYTLTSSCMQLFKCASTVSMADPPEEVISLTGEPADAANGCDYPNLTRNPGFAQGDTRFSHGSSYSYLAINYGYTESDPCASASAWSSSTSYAMDAYVTYNGKLYQARTATTGVIPKHGFSNPWREITNCGSVRVPNGTSGSGTAGKYTIGNDASYFNTSFKGTSRTATSGDFLIANVSSTSTDAIWTSTTYVEDWTQYEVKVRAQRLNTSGSVPTVSVKVNGTTIVSSNLTNIGEWNQLIGTWEGDNTGTASIEVFISGSSAAVGIDDIIFVKKCITPACGVNMIVNGDFSDGGSGPHYSEYIPNVYGYGANPALQTGGGWNYNQTITGGAKGSSGTYFYNNANTHIVGHHGDRKYLIIDTWSDLVSSTTPAGFTHATPTKKVAWGQEIQVKPYTTYIFEFEAASANVNSPGYNPRIQVDLNGSSMFSGGWELSAGANVWQKVRLEWNSGTNTTVSIYLYNLFLEVTGNDFLLDNIVFKEKCGTCTPAELLTNGDLAHTFGDWYESATITGANLYNNGSQGFLKLDDDGVNKLYTDHILTPGTPHRIRFRVLKNTGDVTLAVTGSGIVAGPTPGTSAITNGVNEFWFVPSGAPGSDQLSIETNAQLWIDDISITKVDCEPVSSGFCNPVIVTQASDPTVNCALDQTLLLHYQAYQHFIQYIAQQRALFREHYIAKCLKTYERFQMRYQDGERQYTLYYYDQAGNLVRTIPPAGVVRVDDNETTAAADLQQIREDRDQGTRTYFTKHTMATTYTYNSLNQLTAVNMPDHNTMNIFDVNTTSGLPSGLNIVSTQFQDAQQGFTIANDGTGNSHLFYTQDGGTTWVELTTVGVTNIADVQYLTSTIAYAVGEKGLFLKSSNAGDDWVMNTIGTNGNLKFLHFKDNTHGVLVEENGTVWSTTDGASFTQLTGLSGILQGTLNDIEIGADGSGMAVSSQGANGYLYYTSDYGLTWTVPTDPLLLGSIVALDMVDANKGYAALLDGYLIKTTDAGVTWRFISSNLGATSATSIVQLHFGQELYGVAILDNGQVWKTTNGGANWFPTNMPSTEDAIIMSFTNANNGALITQSGKIFVSVDGGLMWDNKPVATPKFDIASLLNSGETVTAVQPINNSTTDYAFGTSDGRLFIYTPTTNWDPYVHSTSHGAIKDIHVSGSTQASILYDDGTLLFVSGLGSTATWIDQTPTAGAKLMSFSDNSNGLYITYDLGVGSTAEVRYTTTSGSSWGTAYTCSSLMDQVDAIDANTSVGAGMNGIVSRRNSTTGYNWTTAATAQVYPAALNGISSISANRSTSPFASYSIFYVVGNNSCAYIYDIDMSSPLSYTQLHIGTTFEQLQDVALADAAHIAVVGNNGVLASTTNGSSWTVESTNTTTAFTDATYKSGTYFATNAYGKVFYSSSLSSWSSKDASSGVLNAISAYSSSLAMAVGANGQVVKTTDGGANWNNTTDIKPMQLRGATVVEGTSIAYALGDDGNILKSTDGGETWSALNSGTSADLNSIAFSDQNKGAAVGNGVIMYTTNGTSFAPATGIVSGVNYYDVTLSSSGFGLAVGATNGGYGTLLKTNNSGQSWTAITNSVPKNFNAVCIVNDNLAFVAGDDGTLFKIANGTTVTALQNVGSVNWTTEDLKDIWFKDPTFGYAVGTNGELVKTLDGGASWDDKDVSAGTTTINNIGVNPNGQVFLGGPSSMLINLRDEADLYSSKLWYDDKGRVLATQNIKQYNYTGPKGFIYNRYDDLGRVIESGEILHVTEISSLCTGRNTIDVAVFENWLLTGSKREVYMTHYDEVAPVNHYLFNQNPQTLNKRISYVTYSNDGSSVFDQAYYYHYDVQGNVKSLLQQVPAMGTMYGIESGQDHQYKLIEYEYKNAKVISFIYQREQPDQYVHYYEYDQNNRLVNSYTSSLSIAPLMGAQLSSQESLWNQQAKYEYYKHGFRSRVELGHDKVQGVDYAYTLYGWYKGVNSNTLEASRDIGKDGHMTGGLNSNIPKDQMGFSLGYFDTDYTSIGGVSITDNFLSNVNGSALEAANLYNGNITHMTTTIPGSTGNALPQAMFYRHDELNRLVTARAHRDANLIITNDWINSGSEVYDYAEAYIYDGNGNILSLKRNGNDVDADYTYKKVDDLTYYYENTSNGFSRNTNRLLAVTDGEMYAGSTGIPSGQIFTVGGNSNYGYDDLGNLVRDDQEKIDVIEWNATGQITKVTYKNASGVNENDLEILYNISGKRLIKIIKPRINGVLTSQEKWEYTYYIRDESGNIISTYSKNYTSEGGGTYKEYFNLEERPIGGLNRLGIESNDLNLYNRLFTASIYNNEFNSISVVSSTIIDKYLTKSWTGKSCYELTNHLGNTLVGISDRTSVTLSGLSINRNAIVLNTSDYYPFGMLMPGRNSNTDSYRFGFNGKENDTETGWQDYGMRIYNPALAKFLSVDPLSSSFPWNSSYAFAENNVIMSVDLDGAEKMVTIYDENWQPFYKTWVIPSQGITLVGVEIGVSSFLNSFSGGRGLDYKKFLENTYKTHWNIKDQTSLVLQVNSKTGQILWHNINYENVSVLEQIDATMRSASKADADGYMEGKDGLKNHGAPLIAATVLTVATFGYGSAAGGSFAVGRFCIHTSMRNVGTELFTQGVEAWMYGDHTIDRADIIISAIPFKGPWASAYTKAMFDYNASDQLSVFGINKSYSDFAVDFAWTGATEYASNQAGVGLLKHWGYYTNLPGLKLSPKIEVPLSFTIGTYSSLLKNMVTNPYSTAPNSSTNTNSGH